MKGKLWRSEHFQWFGTRHTLRTPESDNKVDEGEAIIQEVILETFTELRKGLEYAY